MSEKDSINPECYELECPHCGKRDVMSGGTMATGAKASLYVSLTSKGELDWDYDEGDVQRDDLYAAELDYQHILCYCEWCNETFTEPKIVPVGEAEQHRLMQRQLEKEGQQRLLIEEEPSI